jgi:cobyrinic acid a,c-diamide synthase
VLGAIPKLGEQHFPERHLGLVPTAEHDWAKDSIAAITKIAEKHLDLEGIVKIAHNAPVFETEDRRQSIQGSGLAFPSRVMARHSEKAVSRRPGIINQEPETKDQKPAASGQRPASSIQYPVSSIENPTPRIGIIRDSAFQFYYPENLEALAAEGAEVVFISPLIDQTLPDLDALYIGGGFPETHARQLANNKNFNARLKALADEGFPIYAECGGLMYLGESLELEGQSHPMVGILPVTFDFYKRPQGHGYTVVQVVAENPYYDVGSEIRGHEFHYSRVSKLDGAKCNLVFRMQRGEGIEKDRDGIVYKNVLATYVHVHALGTPQWARALVRNAIRFKNNRT